MSDRLVVMCVDVQISVRNRTMLRRRGPCRPFSDGISIPDARLHGKPGAESDMQQETS